MGVSYADEEISELHMVDQQMACAGGWGDAVLTWVPVVSRLCVVSSKAVGVQLELLA
jgi:hypothetical protein